MKYWKRKSHYKDTLWLGTAVNFKVEKCICNEKGVTYFGYDFEKALYSLKRIYEKTNKV